MTETMAGYPLDDTGYVNGTCKIGQGHDCCRYLLLGAAGFECGKFSEFRALLDQRVADKTIVARGDNCDGFQMRDKWITQ